MNDAEARLYGLMEIAERQQAAVQAVLDGLAAERKALAECAAALRVEASTIRYSAGELGPGLSRETKAAVALSLAGASAMAVTAVEGAAAPLLAKLSGVVDQAGEVEASLRRVVGWVTWRLMLRGLTVVTVMAVLLWMADVSVWRWAERDLAMTQARKALLEVDVADLEARHDEWVKAGMLGKLIYCGPKERPCVRVDEAAGAFGDTADYRVIQGY